MTRRLPLSDWLYVAALLLLIVPLVIFDALTPAGRRFRNSRKDPR